MRAVRVRDENMIQNTIPAKTIHQRNKSSPALSTLAQAGGAMRMAAKRTAFADVSNMNRGGLTVKDDSAIITKSTLQPLKDAAGQENTRATTLLRPAQRPLSVAGVKGFFNSLASGSSSNLSKAVSAEQRPETILQPANVKKPLARKATTIFKEIDPPFQDFTQTSVVSEAWQPSIVPEILAPQPVLASQKEVLTNPNIMQHLASSYAPKPNVLPELYEVLHREQQRQVNEASYLPIKEHQAIVEPAFGGAPSSHMVPAIVPSQTTDRRQITTILETEEALLPIEVETLQYFEPQGLYDEEQFDDQYEEDGYTTARSFKSRGEYTTGPTTVLLAPRVTAKAERELVAARNYVEGSRAAHEIEEDESWDTSMVAEYGEEIFGYMRVLEVCLILKPV